MPGPNETEWSYEELLLSIGNGSYEGNITSDCINFYNTAQFVSRQYLGLRLDIIVLFLISVSWFLWGVG